MDRQPRLEWEGVALEAGMDPAEVYTRRDLEERMHDAAIERMAVFLSLMLEGVAFERAQAEWRYRKVEEYPDDERTSSRPGALESLAEYIEPDEYGQYEADAQVLDELEKHLFEGFSLGGEEMQRAVVRYGLATRSPIGAMRTSSRNFSSSPRATHTSPWASMMMIRRRLSSLRGRSRATRGASPTRVLRAARQGAEHRGRARGVG